MDKFRIYAKAAIDAGYLLNSSTKVNFVNEAMNPKSNEVLGKFDNVSKLYSSFAWSSGISFGSVDKIVVSLDAIMLSAVLNSNTSTLVKPLVGGGVQLGVQIPF